MGVLAKVCGIVAVFGALNWVALSMAGKDALTMTLGPNKMMTNSLLAVVGLASLLLLIHVIKPAKSKK